MDARILGWPHSRYDRWYFGLYNWILAVSNIIERAKATTADAFPFLNRDDIKELVRLAEIGAQVEESENLAPKRVKKAFIVIVETDTKYPPCIGDVQWALLHEVERLKLDWDVHTTEATAEMLAHHGVPFKEG